MEKLLIIADDFTGSLDTGVQFAGYDARIKILTRPLYDFSSIERDVSVLVVNANTRHLSPEKAYETVYSIVKGALAAGFSHVYKKVDSGLRGNIGSELAAVMDAASLDNIHFVPSFPKLGRFVSGGRLFIDGKPLTESIFAKDPFNPAHSDSVLDIISSSTDKNVILNSFEGNGIHVYDAVTEEDLERLGRAIDEKCDLSASAGCAGFAPYLAKALGYEGSRKKSCVLHNKLLIICGSINPVSFRQMEIAFSSGIRKFPITTSEKINPSWPNSRSFNDYISAVQMELEKNGIAIIDVNTDGRLIEEDDDVKALGLSVETIRVRIAGLLGEIAKRFLDSDMPLTVFSIGGDTLKAIIDSLGCTEIVPVCELDAGVVLNQIVYRDREIPIISKSGGFGDDMTVMRIISKVKENK